MPSYNRSALHHRRGDLRSPEKEEFRQRTGEHSSPLREINNLTAMRIIYCVANKRLAPWVIPHKSGEMSAMQTKGTVRPRIPTESGERAIKRAIRESPLRIGGKFLLFCAKGEHLIRHGFAAPPSPQEKAYEKSDKLTTVRYFAPHQRLPCVKGAPDGVG